MLTLKQGIKLSAIIDKLELKISNPKDNPEQVGADMLMQIIRKAHKAEKEIYTFVAEIKKCTVDEAENIDLIQFIQELFADSGAANFFKSAVKSKVQESSNSFLKPMI